jgi:DNA-binding PadR family transcriptional regulator
VEIPAVLSSVSWPWLCWQLLFERPMHPYEMGLTMKQRHKEDSIKLRYGSLYTVIDTLLARGFISARGVARDGRRPERTVYEITEAGREELRAWMADLIGEPVKEYPQFEAALCLLPVLPPDEALALLRQRLTRIENKVGELEAESADPAVQNLPPLFLVENEYRLALVKADSGGGDGLADIWPIIGGVEYHIQITAKTTA